MALGVGLYIIPLGMVANPSLIELGTSPILAFTAFIKIGLGLAAISFGLIAPLSFLARAALVIFGLLVVFVTY
jgi:hypothetical protein